MHQTWRRVLKPKFLDGVLNILLAKRAEVKPKQIKVNVGSQKGIEGKKPESQTNTASKRQVA